jgi:hypothetical protein
MPALPPRIRPARRRTVLAAAAAALLLAPAAPASATMLVYRDGDDVWQASPDGTIKQRVTTDGAPSSYYSFPSVDDAGTITAIKGYATSRMIWVLPRGAVQPTVNVMPWRISAGVNIGPLWARVKPTTGALLAYGYYLNKGTCVGCGLEERLAIVTPTQPGSSTQPTIDQPGQGRPTWFGDRLVGARNGSIVFETQTLQFTNWLSDPNNAPLTGAEVNRAGTRVLVTRSDGRAVLASWQGTVGSTAGTVTAQCLLPATGIDWAALSPDGTKVAWSGTGGLQVATVTANGTTTCTVSALVTLSATGTTPAFSNATLTLPEEPGRRDPTDPGRRDPTDPGGRDPTDPGGRDPTDPGGRDPTDPGGRDPTDPGGRDPTDPGGRDPTDPGGRDPTDPGGRDPGRPQITPRPFAVAVAKSGRAAALRTALRTTVTVPAPGALTARLTLRTAGRRARTLQLGRARATVTAAGRRTFLIRPARPAAAQLRRGTTLTLRITFTPKTGRPVTHRTTIAVR